MNALYQNPHEAHLLFGRGVRAGMDRREQKKTAVAVTHCKKGRGLIKINGAPIELVEPEILRYKAFEPVLLLGRQKFAGVDMRIKVRGGGHTSQIYAIHQSIAKALVAYYQKFVDEQQKKEIKDILVSHCGLVEEGLEIFLHMEEKCGVGFSQDHLACVIDILGRSGRLTEAYQLVKGMGEEINESIIGAFLNGCRIHGRSDLAKGMAEDILGMDLKKPGGFVTLSNICAANGEWELVENVRELMKKKKVHKKAGSSWIDKKYGFVGF